MRTEQQLLDVVYERAEALRSARRTRVRVALSIVATTVVAAGIVVAASVGDGGNAALVAGPAVGDAPTGPSTSAGSTEATGHLEIAAIGMDVEFVEGISVDQLEAGPGHYPETPLPGHAGNTAIAGHRSVHGGPFGRLDDLTAGDRIVATTAEGTFTYEVRETLTVDPSAVAVIGPTFWADRWGHEAPSTLTLTTEAPADGARGRLVVGAELIGEPLPDRA